jgi:VanZ family protein
MSKNLISRFNDSIFQRPALRLLYALAWTALVTLVLVQSSSHPVVGPAAPPGPPTLEREILLTSGHVVAFSILTFLWWWALIPLSSYALTQAIMIGLILGIVTEWAQTLVPDRSASLFDMATNTVVIGLTAWVIRSKIPGNVD